MAERRVGDSLPARFVGPNRRCIVRSRSSAVLLALAIAALAPSFGVAQYTPKWHVGDWWLTKTLAVPPEGGGPVWRYKRYDVVRIGKVGKRDCYVLQTVSSGPKAKKGLDTVLYYVRVDDWLVVREDVARFYSDKPRGMAIMPAPLGLFGPHPGELALPRFPLRLDDPDTTFKLTMRERGPAELREISSTADPATVKRLLDVGDSATVKGLFGWVDSTRIPALRPAGIVYQVRNELGGDLGTDNELIIQSLQFWCDDLPWRVYEEHVQYTGPNLVRRVERRTWLIACGRGGR